MTSIDDADKKWNVIDDMFDTAEDMDGPIDLKEAGLSQRDALLMISDASGVWRSPEGEAFVSVPVDGHTEHHAVRSRSFRNLMRHQLACRFSQGGRPAAANKNVMNDVLDFLEARALRDGTIYRAAIRSIEYDGAIYIDRGTEDWSVICITPEGWTTMTKSPVPILRGKRTAPFPTPALIAISSLCAACSIILTTIPSSCSWRGASVHCCRTARTRSSSCAVSKDPEKVRLRGWRNALPIPFMVTYFSPRGATATSSQPQSQTAFWPSIIYPLSMPI